MSQLVSIIVPCYNAERWLDECLRSALTQTWTNCEVILVDDGSTDQSLALARRYESQGLKIITQPNRGAAAARNTGLRAATGAYIQFLDADDLLTTDKIAAQLARLELAPTDALAFCRWGRFTEDPNKIVFADEDLACDFTPIAWLRLHCRAGRMMHPAAWLIPRPIIERAGQWNESLSLNDDGEYFSRVVLAASQLVCAHSGSTLYRSDLPGSLSHRRSATALSSLYRSVQLVAENFDAADHTPETQQALADYWQRLEFELALDAPALAADAATHAKALGGSSLRIEAGPTLRAIAALFGLRMALRLRRLSAWRSLVLKQ